MCFLWIEEAYEITSESDFDMLQESIRGQVPNGLFKQITLTLNPWSENHWIKKRFFDCEEDDDILAISTNYLINEWLDDADKKMFEDMKKNNPKRYQVAGLGNWGITDGLIYDNFETQEFNLKDILTPENETVFGLDFGYTNDPTALFCGMVDFKSKKLYVFDELYEKSLTNFDIADRIRQKGYSKERIVSDAAEPKSIHELRTLGINGCVAAKKGKDSVLHGIQYIQGFKIIIHPKCKNFINEINNYTWDKDKSTGKSVNKPIDDYNHLLDAMRYALEKYSLTSGIQFA